MNLNIKGGYGNPIKEGSKFTHSKGLEDKIILYEGNTLFEVKYPWRISNDLRREVGAQAG